MNIVARGFLALRLRVLVGSIVLWNLLMLFGAYLARTGEYLREAMLVVAFACLITSVLGYLVVGNRSMQKWALRSEDQNYFDRAPFFMLASIALLLSIVAFLSAFEIGGFELPSRPSVDRFRLRFSL